MPSSDRPAPFLTAMLEGSFASLIWLSAIAFAAPDPHYRNLAMLAIGAVSIAITIMLALPSSWLRRPRRTSAATDRLPTIRLPAQQLTNLAQPTPSQPAHRGEHA